jgi:hypothetical protein
MSPRTCAAGETPVKKKKIKTSSAKAKGRNLQKLTGEKISILTGYTFGKDEMIASREMGQNGTDIRLIADAREAFPWSVECKAGNSFSFPDAVRQAKANQLPSTDWLLVTRRDRESALVTIDMDVFFDLLRLIPGHKKGRK